MGTFTDSLKNWFYRQSTQAPLSTAARLPLLDANGNPIGSSPLSTIGSMLMKDVFFIDDNIDDPALKVTGTVNGAIARYIRRHSHRYLVKKIDDGKVAICPLSDTNSNYFYDGTTAATLNGTQGDVMVKLPPFYYECVETETTHKWQITLALRDVTGTMQYWDGTQLLGAYEGYVSSNKLYSVSGVQSTGSVSQANFKTYARNRGTGYTIMKWQQHNIYGMLFYAMHGNTNSQAIIGSGTNSYTKATGSRNTLGMNDTIGGDGGNGNTGSIMYMGLENIWGNKGEFVDNVVVDYNSSGQRFIVTEDDGTSRTVIAPKGEKIHIFPTKMVLGTYFDLIAAPDNVIGNTTKGYCDGFYMTNSGSVILDIGSAGNSVNGGVAALDASLISSNGNYNYVTARLAFKGDIVRYNNISAFTALQIVA